MAVGQQDPVEAAESESAAEKLALGTLAACPSDSPSD